MAISNGQVEEVMRLIASGVTAKVRSLNLYIHVHTCTGTCTVIISWLLLVETLQLLHSPTCTCTCVHLRTQRRSFIMLQQVAGLKK